MFARHGAAAQAGKADRAFFARAGVPVASAFGMAGEIDPARPCRSFAEQQRGPAGGIDLAPMMHFEDFDIPIGPQPGGGLTDQMREQRLAERGIACLEHRHRACGIVDRGMMPLLEPGRADHQRHARAERGMEVDAQRAGGRKIDQYLACIGQPGRVAALVDPARQFMPACTDHGGKRMAHGAFAPDNPDPRHSFPYRPWLMAGL